MSIAARVATRYRIVKAFTYAEALEVFGYRRDERPTREEVNSRYRSKIKELMKANPDAIRDQQIMKPFNQAKDILTGQLEPDRSPGDFRPHSPDVDFTDVDYDGNPTGQGRKQPDTIVTWEEAKADAKIPADVKWFFVTDNHRGDRDYNSDEFSNSTSGYVACGETDTHWVLVTVQHYYYQAYSPGVTDGKTDVWNIDTFKYPKKAPVPTAAELYGYVKKVWKEFKYPMKDFNSKVVDARGWDFGKVKPTGRVVSIKMLVSDSTGAEFTGKMKVELQRKCGPWGKPAPAGFYKPKYGDPFQYVLIINGREHDLDESDIEKLYKLRVGGKPFDNRVYGDYPEHIEQPKDLTRNRDGKEIMKWMAEHLAHLPDWARKGLTRAVDQGKKTAHSYERRAP